MAPMSTMIAVAIKSVDIHQIYYRPLFLTPIRSRDLFVAILDKASLTCRRCYRSRGSVMDLIIPYCENEAERSNTGLGWYSLQAQ